MFNYIKNTSPLSLQTTIYIILLIVVTSIIKGLIIYVYDEYIG